jgi:pimeloyl-ACP methyl ester carboxylesterase
MQFAMKRVQAGGCDVQYREGGAGQTVVFLHGGGGHHWDEETFTTLAQSYRLLLPSAPGFDESTAGQTDTIEDVADVMAAFIAAVADGGPVNVIGESFGGYVASWLAIRQPQVVDKLVLAAPAGLRQDGTEHPSHMSPAELQVALYGHRPVPPPPPEEAEQRLRNRANSARIGRSRPQFDQALLARLSEIRSPTLVLWGTEDAVVWPAQARHYQERIPTVRVDLVPGGPHVLSAAVPELFLPPLQAFLEQ